MANRYDDHPGVYGSPVHSPSYVAWDVFPVQ